MREWINLPKSWSTAKSTSFKPLPKKARLWADCCAFGWIVILCALGAHRFDLLIIPCPFWLIPQLYFGVLVMLPVFNPDYLDRGKRIKRDEKKKLREILGSYCFGWLGYSASAAILYYFK